MCEIQQACDLTDRFNLAIKIFTEINELYSRVRLNLGAGRESRGLIIVFSAVWLVILSIGLGLHLPKNVRGEGMWKEEKSGLGMKEVLLVISMTP